MTIGLSLRGRSALATMLLVGSLSCGGENARQCDVSGHACNWAGQPGLVGFNGDGHDRLETRLYWTMDLMFAQDGTPWFIDWNNHLIRKVLPDGTVKSVVGWTDPPFPGDGAMTERSAEGAPGTEVQLNHPTDLAERADGVILFMAWHNHKLRQIDPSTGRVRIVSGAGAGFSGDGGPGGMATYRQPSSLELASDGTAYILDQQNFRVRKVAPDGIITTIAGNGMQGYGGDGGPALSAMLNFEAGSNPEPSGGLALAERKLYISDTMNHRIRVLDLDSNMIETLAGTGEAAFGGDGGPATAAKLRKPHDLEIGPEGHLYVADTDNSRIRAIDLATGIIRTVAGNGNLGLDPTDDRSALETTLRRPFGIAFDRAGNLYIADTINSRILKVAR